MINSICENTSMCFGAKTCESVPEKETIREIPLIGILSCS